MPHHLLWIPAEAGIPSAKPITDAWKTEFTGWIAVTSCGTVELREE